MAYFQRVVISLATKTAKGRAAASQPRRMMDNISFPYAETILQNLR
jgi:hypothetical protein